MVYIIAINLYCTKYFSYIATTYLLIDYDLIFWLSIYLSLHDSWIHPPILSHHGLAHNWHWCYARKFHKSVSRALRKSVLNYVRMVPTIKHDFVRHGSQRESFRVVEREDLWRIARWNDEPKTRVRSKSYTSRSFVLWDHCRWRCCDGRRRKITFRETRPVLQREAQSVI